MKVSITDIFSSHKSLLCQTTISLNLVSSTQVIPLNGVKLKLQKLLNLDQVLVTNNSTINKAQKSTSYFCIEHTLIGHYQIK